MFRLPSDVASHLQRGGTLLVPTRQRLRAVQLAHAAAELDAGRRVWASVDVLTPPRWARRECERRSEDAPGQWPRVLSPTEEWLLWREAAREATREHPFLESDLLAESLQRASDQAAEFGIAVVAGAPESEATLLYQTQCGFEARCRTLNAASVSTLTARLRGTGAPRPLLLRGFDAIPPWLGALAARAESQGSQPEERPGASVRGVRTPDGLSQMEAIAAWCRERLRARPDARLLVMLPGPAGTRERLASLIRDALDPGATLADERAARALVAIEGGEPFATLALPAQALLTLTLLAGADIELGSISRWLTSPCWVSPAAARAHLALLLRQHGPTSMKLREFLGTLQLAPRELKGAARELEDHLRRAERRLADGVASPRRWSERFEAALSALGWPGVLPPDGAGQQTRLRWRELLEEFGELAASVPSLTLEAALELLQALARRTSYRVSDEGAAVTVTGILTDPIVIYDGIWVGSLDADLFPQPPTPNPFLSLPAQLAAAVPEASVSGRRRQAERLLGSWRCGARELVLSVPKLDEDRELLPSPCLAGLVLEEETPSSLWLPLRLRRDGCTERLTDVSGMSFNPLTPLPGGTRALTLQNACAFRAYAELRLGAGPPEVPEPGVPMDQRGLLLHAALQMLWDELRNSNALAGLDQGALDVLIAQCVAQAARALQAEVGSRRRRRARRAPDAQFDLFAVLSPALERECARAERLIRRLCALELTRQPFAIEATEHITELTLGGGRVRLRLDRVDRVANGLAVLDYKSGRPGSPDWYGERPTHPQLLAYLTAMGSEVVALATVNVTAREVRFTGVAATAGVLPRVNALPAGGNAAADWPAQQRSWEELIGRLIGAFLAGDARVDPAPGACDYCHLTDLCRIGAHLAPEAVARADETDE